MIDSSPEFPDALGRKLPENPETMEIHWEIANAGLAKNYHISPYPA
jgi:hypothetical protein